MVTKNSELKDLISKYTDYVNCDEYHIHHDMPEDHITANADPNDGHIDFDEDVFLSELEKQLQLARLDAKIEALKGVICHKHGFGHDSCPQIKQEIAELTAQKAHLTTKGGDHE